MSYHSCHIYGRPGKAYRLGEYFRDIIGGKPRRDGTIFMEEVDASRELTPRDTM